MSAASGDIYCFYFHTKYINQKLLNDTGKETTSAISSTTWWNNNDPVTAVTGRHLFASDFVGVFMPPRFKCISLIFIAMWFECYKCYTMAEGGFLIIINGLQNKILIRWKIPVNAIETPRTASGMGSINIFGSLKNFVSKRRKLLMKLTIFIPQRSK